MGRWFSRGVREFWWLSRFKVLPLVHPAHRWHEVRMLRRRRVVIMYYITDDGGRRPPTTTRSRRGNTAGRRADEAPPENARFFPYSIDGVLVSGNDGGDDEPRRKAAVAAVVFNRRRYRRRHRRASSSSSSRGSCCRCTARPIVHLPAAAAIVCAPLLSVAVAAVVLSRERLAHYRYGTLDDQFSQLGHASLSSPSSSLYHSSSSS